MNRLNSFFKVSVLAFGVFFVGAGTLISAEEPIQKESAPTGQTYPENERVIVVANADDPESLEIANHYMRMRKVPERNLVAFPMPKKETISWDEFSSSVFSPLRRELSARGLIDGVVRDSVPADEMGRVRLAFPENFDPASRKAERISYLVVCRGVPLKIASSAKSKSGGLGTDCAAVDSELALLGVPDTATGGTVSNPYFKKNLEKPNPFAPLFLKVARLDGITAADAKALVDNAIKAEQNGLMGRAYIDIGGPYKQGDNWFEECAETTQKLGFETSVDRSKSLMDASSRYDAPAMYFGWYTSAVGGFFRDPKFRFPPGAIAIHIYSYSASSMRAKNGWTPGFVARGVTATVGNVYEPYLGMTHYPHFFLEALAEGKTAGDAAAYSIPVFSWQGVFIGDPLYKPFNCPVEDQVDAAIERPTKLSQYAFLRAANLAKNEGNSTLAERYLKSGAMFAPGLAMNFALSEKEFAAKGACVRTIPIRAAEIENPGLLLEVARLWAKASRASDALAIYETLLGKKLVPSFVREKVLKEACDLARSRGDSRRLSVWFPEYESILKEKATAAARAKAAKAKAAAEKKAKEKGKTDNG